MVRDSDVSPALVKQWGGSCRPTDRHAAVSEPFCKILARSGLRNYLCLPALKSDESGVVMRRPSTVFECHMDVRVLHSDTCDGVRTNPSPWGASVDALYDAYSTRGYASSARHGRPYVRPFLRDDRNRNLVRSISRTRPWTGIHGRTSLAYRGSGTLKRQAS